MLIPALVVATFIEEHTLLVDAKACGMELISILSPLVNPF